MHLATQVDELRAGGSRVETIFPDGDSLNAFGVNMMDPSTSVAAPTPSLFFLLLHRRLFARLAPVFLSL